MPDNRIDYLRRRIQKDAASIAFAQLAEELRRAGRCEESVEICRAGLAIHPSYLSARVTLGRALIELNQLAGAQSELELVLKSARENLAAIRGLGEIHHRQGNPAAAPAQYRAALALAKNDPDLQETVAQLAGQVEPPMPSGADDSVSVEPPAADETPSLDQIDSELLKFAPPETPPAEEETELAPAIEEPVPSEAELEHAARTLAALARWLDAIHVARADRRA
jgi:tetratricopeptide (TPR) repeat protein